MTKLNNFTYEEIAIGQTASYVKTVTEKDIQLFAAASGDVNPVHLDEAFAAGTQFKERIAHGMLTGAFISAALAMKLPGPGTIYLGQTLRFRLPVKIGDTITVALSVAEKKDRRQQLVLDCTATNQHGKVVVTGSAEVMAPAEKLSIEQPAAPQF